MVGILDFYGSDKTKFTEVAGPGNFNDPDMVGVLLTNTMLYSLVNYCSKAIFLVTLMSSFHISSYFLNSFVNCITTTFKN